MSIFERRRLSGPTSANTAVRLMAILVAVASAVGLTIALARIVTGAGYGFGAVPSPTSPDRYLVILNPPTGPVSYSGLHSGDQIVAVNGVPVTAGEPFQRILDAPGRPGDRVTFRVQRVVPGSATVGPPENVVITLYPVFGNADLRLMILSFLFTAVVLASVSVTTALVRPDLAAARILLIRGAALSFAVICGLLQAAPSASWPWIVRANTLLFIVGSAALLHFFLVFPTVPRFSARLRAMGPPALRKLGGGIVLIYLVPVVTEAVILAFSPTAFRTGYYISVLMLVPAALFAVRALGRVETAVGRAQLTGIVWVGVVFAAAVLIQSGNYLIGTRELEGPTQAAAVVMGGLLALAQALAVLRYGLFEVDRVVRATITYFLVSVTLILGYLIVALAFSRVIELVAGPVTANPVTVAVLAALVVGLLAEQIHRRLTKLLDRLLFRSRIARQRFLAEALVALGQVVPPTTVAEFLVGHAATRLGLTGAWLIFPAATRERSASVLPEAGLLDRIAGLEEPTLLVPTEIASGGLPTVVARDPITVEWYGAGARVIVPLRAPVSASSAIGSESRTNNLGTTRTHLIGAWILGARRSHELPDRDDLAVLKQVGQQASVLLDHARLSAAEVQQALISQDLTRARQIQQRMLPVTTDAWRTGWPGRIEIAWRFRAAHETGGDFFDVLPLREEAQLSEAFPPLQLAVGDAQDKGIGAALVMGLAQATLRTAALARPDHSPATTLRVAGQLLHQDRPRRQLVACALAVVEIEPSAGEGSPHVRFRLANAGQVSPVLYRASAMVELETPGERLPLGALPNPSYADLDVVLRPGDVITFVSDGILEARLGGTNLGRPQSGSFFGFERLNASIGASARPGDSADEVAAGVWQDVLTWIGDDATSLYDDMTLVVLRVTPPSGPTLPDKVQLTGAATPC